MLARRAASLNGLDDIEGGIGADDDVVATGVNGVTRFHGDPSVALAAHHLHAADDSPAMKVAVVETALGQPIGLLIIQIRLGQ